MKSRLWHFLSSSVLAPLLLASIPAFSETVVGGGYHADQVWTKANSPYRVTSDVVLFPGWKLTIEPGVRVLFGNNTGLEIRGKLKAEGTAADSIVFEPEQAGTEPAWNGIVIANTLGGRGSFRFARVSRASQALGVECCAERDFPGPFLTVAHGRFTGNGYVSNTYSGSYDTFDSCVFQGNDIVFTSADKQVSHSLFKDNRIGLWKVERFIVVASEFSGNTELAVSGNLTSDSCLISGSPVGIKSMNSGSITLTHSFVSGNDTGLILNGSYNPAIHGNRFDNTLMNAVHTGGTAVDMSGNWWGTTVPSVILSKLKDARTDANLGLITFSPYWADIGGSSSLTYTDPPESDTGSTLTGSWFKDMVLTKAKSPYTLEGDAVLQPGHILTIEPGVVVKAKSGATLTIRGKLKAEGTATDSIVFEPEQAGTEPAWNGIVIANTLGGRGSFRFARVSRASQALGVECCAERDFPGPFLTVVHGRFTGNGYVSNTYSGSYDTFDSCVFQGNDIVFTAGDKQISHSLFKDNRIGLNGTERTNVIQCEFTGHEIALRGGGGEVRNCRITGNHFGIVNQGGGFETNNSTISGNDTGIVLADNGFSAGITQCNIDNKKMNVVNTGPHNILITFNWWGSKDTAAIVAKIHDGFDDPRLGLVYQPYFTDSLPKSAFIHTIDSTSTTPVIRDSAAGVVIRLDTADNPSGKVAICEGDHPIAGLGGVKSVDIAISSDLKGKLSSAKLTIDYAKEGLDNRTALDLKIFHLNGETWEVVGGTVDTSAKTVTVTVTHFSTYGLFKVTKPVPLLAEGPPAGDAWKVGGNGRWVMVPLPLKQAGKLVLQVRDMRGRLVSEWNAMGYPESGRSARVFVPRAILGNGLYSLRVSAKDADGRVLIRSVP